MKLLPVSVVLLLSCVYLVASDSYVFTTRDWVEATGFQPVKFMNYSIAENWMMIRYISYARPVWINETFCMGFPNGNEYGLLKRDDPNCRAVFPGAQQGEILIPADQPCNGHILRADDTLTCFYGRLPSKAELVHVQIFEDQLVVHCYNQSVQMQIGESMQCPTKPFILRSGDVAKIADYEISFDRIMNAHSKVLEENPELGFEALKIVPSKVITSTTEMPTRAVSLPVKTSSTVLEFLCPNSEWMVVMIVSVSVLMVPVLVAVACVVFRGSVPSSVKSRIGEYADRKTIEVLEAIKDWVLNDLVPWILEKVARKVRQELVDFMLITEDAAKQANREYEDYGDNYSMVTNASDISRDGSHLCSKAVLVNIGDESKQESSFLADGQVNPLTGGVATSGHSSMDQPSASSTPVSKDKLQLTDDIVLMPSLMANQKDGAKLSPAPPKVTKRNSDASRTSCSTDSKSTHSIKSNSSFKGILPTGKDMDRVQPLHVTRSVSARQRNLK